MRICLYTATALPKLGGQELMVDALARELVARGHDVRVLAPKPRKPLSAAEDSAKPYQLIRHPRFLSTRYFVAWYRRFIAQQMPRVDVVHCHDVYPTGWLAVLARNTPHPAAKVPVVITSHGGDLNEGNVRIVKPGVEQRCRTALEQADLLVSIGRFTLANFKRLTASHAPVVEIPNGVHVAQLSSGEEARPSTAANFNGGDYLLYLGRLHPRKGVDVLLKAIAQLPSARLLIAGDGEMRTSLEALSRELGLGDRVVFLGRQTGANKTWLLRHARAVVIPSQTWEAFPLVVLEGAAAGKAIVATRVPGLEDLVINGETGRLVEKASVEALATGIREVWDNAELANAWGTTAQARVERYDWARVAGEYEAAYRQVLSV